MVRIYLDDLKNVKELIKFMLNSDDNLTKIMNSIISSLDNNL